MPMALTFLTLIETILFVLGVALPLAEVSQFWLFDDEFSVLGLLVTFITEGEFVLFLVVAIFGVVLPLLKMILKLQGIGGFWVAFLYRFALTDIFLLAILVYLVKASSTLSIGLLEGFWCLLGSILLGHGIMAYSMLSGQKGRAA
ncbi:MAG TPA: hypothetical protein DHV03_06865 [Alphaproteobacteria bacterium]|mgnify:CR=1 FL=1|nr:MAG: hypothetical protein DBW67_06625 [SAR116 cluster bacterium]HCJ62325.1 hypothetical protein [Alphaproteobacteria bacterium]HCY48387.1 hypothetical protein [Alphaproteobacteria bacterium]